MTSSEHVTGQVLFFNHEHRYGFARIVWPLEKNGEEVFIHGNDVSANLPHSKKKLATGEIVTFKLVESKPKNRGVDIGGIFASDGSRCPMICQLGTFEFNSYSRLQFKKKDKKKEEQKQKQNQNQNHGPGQNENQNPDPDQDQDKEKEDQDQDQDQDQDLKKFSDGMLWCEDDSLV